MQQRTKQAIAFKKWLNQLNKEYPHNSYQLFHGASKGAKVWILFVFDYWKFIDPEVHLVVKRMCNHCLKVYGFAVKMEYQCPPMLGNIKEGVLQSGNIFIS